MTRQIGLLLLVVLLAMAAACRPPATQGGGAVGPRSWIDSPLQGSRLPLGPVDIVSRARHPAGVAQVELSVNGAVVARSDNAQPGEAAFVANQVWQPSAPGNYALQVRAKSAAGIWGEYARVDVQVEEAAEPPAATPTPSPSASPTALPPTPTPTGTPTATPEAATAAPTTAATPARAATAVPAPPTPTETPVVISVPTVTGPSAGISAPSYSPAVFYTGACGPQQVTIEVKPLAGHDVAAVRVFFALADKASGAVSGWTSLEMAQGDGKFTRTIAAAEIPNAGAHASAWFQFYFVATDSQGRESKSVGYYTSVSLARCN